MRSNELYLPSTNICDNESISLSSQEHKKEERHKVIRAIIKPNNFN